MEVQAKQTREGPCMAQIIMRERGDFYAYTVKGRSFQHEHMTSE